MVHILSVTGISSTQTPLPALVGEAIQLVSMDNISLHR